MAQEATLRLSLQILKTSQPAGATEALKLIDYQSRPTDFRMDVNGTKGPTPGALTATPTGVDVDFSQLVSPALTFIKNLDSTNEVSVGIWDPETGKFYPVMRIKPGQGWPICLDPNLGFEYTGTGTVTGARTNRLRIKSMGAPANVSVESFEA